MTEPTKEELSQEIARYENYQNDYRNWETPTTVRMRSLTIVLHALRLAANLPSQIEMTKIIIDNPDYHQAAARILERIRSVK